MSKKCMICEDPAEFCIKDTSTYYCKDCAVEQFGDINLLIAIEDRVSEIKGQVDIIFNGEESKEEE